MDLHRPANPRSRGAGHYRRPGTSASYCGRTVEANPTEAKYVTGVCQMCAKAEQRDRVAAEQTAADRSIDGPTLAQRAGVRYALVGKGRRVHYSNTDDTLCGRAVSEYTDGLDNEHTALCAPCITAAEQRVNGRGNASEPEHPAGEQVATPPADVEPTPAVVRDEPSDWWTITDPATGEEITRVYGATWQEMAPRAEALPEVRVLMRKHGGFSRRRLLVSELTPAQLAEQAPTRPVIEGVVVEHAGTAEGSHPRHATHPDVIAARAALDGLAAATVTDQHDISEPTEDETDVRGYCIDPRTGAARVYWLEAGRIVRRDQMPHGPALDCIADRLRSRGWSVWPMLPSSQCVIADRPADDAQAPAPAAQPTTSTADAPGCTECRGVGCHWCHWTGADHLASAEQVEGDAEQAPVVVRMSFHPADLDRIKAKADADRAAWRAEMDERQAADHVAHGAPVPPALAARIEARRAAEQVPGMLTAATGAVYIPAPVQAPDVHLVDDDADRAPCGSPVFPGHRCRTSDPAGATCAHCLRLHAERAAAAELAGTVETVEEADRAAGTWRGGWVGAPAGPTDVLFTLADDQQAEQGALFS